MKKFIQVLGFLWSCIGVGNIIGMFFKTSNINIITFGLLVNMVFFVIPGLALYSLGEKK